MASRPTRKLKYKGDLAAPIRDDVTDQELIREVYRKLELLYQHYGITGGTAKERAEELAVALAFAHVPGFSVKSRKQPGRPIEWTGERLFKLHVDAWLCRCDLKGRFPKRKIRDTDVIKALRRNSKLLEEEKWLEDEKTLYRRYSQAKRKWGAGLDGIVREITKIARKRSSETKTPEHHGALPPPHIPRR